MTTPHCILLVADQPGHRHLVAGAVGSRAEVVEGDQGRLTDGAYDLVVVDDTVLDRTWRELTWRKARERPALLPAMVLSARHGAGLVAKVYEGAVDDITTVPIDPAALRVRLDMLLQARRTSIDLVRARSLVDELPAGVFHMASSGELLDAGAGLAEMLGVSSAQALVGTGLAEHLARPADAFALLELARADGSVRDFDLVFARADGGALPVRVFARLVAEEKGSGVTAVAFARGGNAPAGYTLDLVTGSRTPEHVRPRSA